MAQYLPVLLLSVSAVSTPAPDDSSLDTQAIGQVDYLSHDWQEEDVARSWRNMTRRKDSIQNGARLENASWRTWWKQRNNLPTVSPETLNWLKDSDVTWLYGPLHTANDWAPPPRQPQSSSTAQASIDAQTQPRNHSPSTPSRSNSPWGLKPILKHRSISELLSISFPNTPNSDALELPAEGYFTDRSALASQRTQSHDSGSRQAHAGRPRLTHTKSDTNVLRRNPFRGDSPPLPLIPENAALGVPKRSHSLTVAASASSSSSPGSQDGASSGAESSTSTQQQKRHISFNTFVEQCIAIEKPQAYDEEEEEEEEEYYDEAGYREDDEDSNEDYDSEEDVLEMKSSRRNSLRSNEPSLSGLDLIHPPEREHVTIAPIAPTILKTSASPSPVYGANPYGWSEEDEDELFRVGSVSGSRTQPPPPEAEIEESPVPLVFVPPQGSVYAERLGVNGARAFGGYPYGRRSRSSSSSPGGSFDDAAEAYRGSGSDENDVVEVVHDESEGYPVVSSEVVYEPYGGGPGDEASSLSTSTTGSVGSEVRSTDSKGGSSEGEGTIVPAGAGGAPSSLASSSGSIASASEGSGSGSGSGSQVDTTATSKPIPVPHVPGHSPARYHHAHQSPSPAPSAGSTSTSTTSSPLLDVDYRGRSTSPITSVSPSGDSSRGRSMRRSSTDRLKAEKDERDPPRGRSRSRSIGGADGSVSPRSGLSRKASTEGIGIGSLGGYGGSAYSCGPRERRERDVSSSLSPDDGERRSGRIGRVAVGRNVGYGRRVGSDDGSSSLSPPARETLPRSNSYTLRASNTKPIDIPLNVPVSAASAASPVLPPAAVAVAATSVAVLSPANSTTTTPTSSGTPTPTITSGTATPTSTSTSASTIVIPAPAVISTPPTPPSISKPSTPTVGVAASSPMAIPPPGVASPSAGEASLVGRAMSSAKGYLGAFWGNNGQAETAAR